MATKKRTKSRNKITAQADKLLMTLKEKGWAPVELAQETEYIKSETPSFLSRLEVATIKYEQAVKEAIEALKGIS